MQTMERSQDTTSFLSMWQMETLGRCFAMSSPTKRSPLIGLIHSGCLRRDCQTRFPSVNVVDQTAGLSSRSPLSFSKDSQSSCLSIGIPSPSTLAAATKPVSKVATQISAKTNSTFRNTHTFNSQKTSLVSSLAMNSR